MAVLNESSFICQIGGPFNQLAVTEKSGGEVSRESTRYPDPLLDQDYFTLGRRSVSNLVLRVPYDATVHEPLIQTVQTQCQTPSTITVQAIKQCPDTENDGPAVTYTGCLLVKIKRPDMKRGTGASVAMLEFEFAVTSV